MPIRINLLAEDQAAEELRRKDPAKRAIWVAAGVAGLVLCFSGWLLLRVRYAARETQRYEAQWNKMEKDFQRVTQHLKDTAEIERKLTSLHQLATNRFLWGPVLNAIQEGMIDHVQLARLRSSQTYVQTEEVKPVVKNDKKISGKPATSTEKIFLVLEAKDSAPSPGVQVNLFKESIATTPYFKQHLKPGDGVKLAELSPPDTSDPSRPFVMFTLNCLYPERVRTR